ncbi:MFS transporter [Croceibacterium mercuriale]|uniref:MFS transporter n=1 Tax=Croceibacterium mercuriale TaxID=1572751 RepID=A0A0B2BZI6_9SPHN|nr:MFS transporter [Croceibacterium mercuriale]KHL25250.1 MFS transporter [Croceibacterium mercuriale]
MRQATGDTRPGIVLAMLLLVYICNFVDRQILAILAAPIQRDLLLDDAQMGLLGGVAFALLYATCGVPLSALADRTGRARVIGWSLVVWSACTALCAAAQGFWHIFLARLGVGVGEAGGVAPSYALIGEYFPSHQRARALAIYSLGIPIGSAAGVLAGGTIAALVDWRLAFMVVGAVGLVLAPVFMRLVRDRPAAARVAPTSLRRTAGLLVRRRSFWLLSLAQALASMAGYGIVFWLPSVLQRSFGLDLLGSAQFFAGLLLLGGIAGVLGGGWLGDRLGRRDRAWHAWLPGMAFLLSAPLFAAGIVSGNWRAAFALFLVPQALSYFWMGPILSAVQHLVAAAERSMASALFLLVNNLLGLAGGTWALGLLADRLRPLYGDDALRHAMLWSLLFYLAAGLLLLAGGRWIRQDWMPEPAPQAG